MGTGKIPPYHQGSELDQRAIAYKMSLTARCGETVSGIPATPTATRSTMPRSMSVLCLVIGAKLIGDANSALT